MHKHSHAAAILALCSALALAACAPNPADNVPAASVSEPGAANNPATGSDSSSAPADASTAGSDATGAYPGGAAPTSDASTSGYPAPDAASGGAAAPGSDVVQPAGAAIPLEGSIGVLASKVTRTHNIVFQDWNGTFDPGDGSPASAKLAFEVRTDSLISDPNERGMMSDRLDTHLKSDEFFHIEQFPTAIFTSTSIVEGAENGATHTVTGDLTIRGKTKTITFPITVAGDGNVVSAKTEFSLNRQDFDLTYTGQPDDLVRDEVVMQVDVTGTMGES
jgi:polyisoprenoid-binding protein YceI